MFIYPPPNTNLMKKKEETFLLVSMKEDKAKKLAQVISSETARKILDFLAQAEATESDISKEMAIPLSTVHYNLQQLLAANLIKAEEFHYSEKGKEVLHYSLANKFIIIAPDSKEGLSVKIKQILPSLGVLILGAGVIFLFRWSGSDAKVPQAAPPRLMAEAGADMAAKAVPAMTYSTQTPISPVIWFLLGGICVLAAFMVTIWLAGRPKA
jgi:DNA-binding transcriptional ArsR family regulator